ncbi:MAG: ABC transporter permease [Alsobacter sp.]
MTRPVAARSLAAPLCLLMATTFFAFLSPTFIGLENLANVGSQMWVLALLAVGQMFAIASRGFDISVGSVAALSSTVAALSANAIGLPGLLAGALVGLACGTVNGLLVGSFGLQPVVATLGVLIGAKGVALLVSGDGQVVPLVAADEAARLAFDRVAGLPVSAWLAMAPIAAAAWLLHAAAGRRILMLGSNPEAVALVGIHAARTQLLAYQLSGLFAGLAGVLMTVRAGSGLPTEGAGMELQSIAAAVIGGTPLTGGSAGVAGVVLGAAFIQVLLTGLNLMGVSPFVAQSAIGLVIIGSGLLAFLLKSASSPRTKGTSA